MGKRHNASREPARTATNKARWPAGVAIAIAAGILAGWSIWAFAAEIPIYETSTARIEVGAAAHPIHAGVPGQVAVVHVELGQWVAQGELLVELDARAQVLQLAEQRARQEALAAQIDPLRAQIAADDLVTTQDALAARIAVDQANARSRAMAAQAGLERRERNRMEQLTAAGIDSAAELDRVSAGARRSGFEARAARLEAERLSADMETTALARRAQREELRRTLASLEGEVSVTEAEIRKLELDIERRKIRSPIAGRVGEIGDLHAGTVVAEGARLGSVIPQGDLRVVAEFPARALGRVRPGQSARVRLDGFAWAEYGSLGASVARVAGEVRDGKVRVELALGPDAAPRIPREHGLPGSVEIEIERVSPAALVLRRVTGQLGPTASGHDVTSQPTGGQP